MSAVAWRTEADFWRAIRKGLPARTFARRIEDNSGNLGTFDTFIGRRGRAGWLELKVAGPNAKPSLRPGQPSFGAQCFDAGVPAAYLVGSPNGRVRLIGPLTVGDDWRDHLVMSWDSLCVPEVLGLLLEGGDHGQSEPIAKHEVFEGQPAA